MNEAEIKAIFAMLFWVDRTKGRLSPSDVLTGLIDHGLFCEKVLPCHVCIRYEALRDTNVPRHPGIPHRQARL